MNTLKNDYLKLSNIPKASWSQDKINKLVSLALTDERVEDLTFLNKVDDEKRPIFKINSNVLNGVFPASIIAANLYESKAERDERLAKEKRINVIRDKLQAICTSFFEMNEITVEQAIALINQLKKEIPEKEDGFLFHASIFSKIDEDLEQVVRFEKAMKKNKVTQNDILRTIYIYKSGRRASEKNQKIMEKVGNFFSEFFNYSNTMFSWREYSDMYRLDY